MTVPDAGPALVVDLDGTLLRGYSLHEALLGLPTVRPMSLMRLPARLAAGKVEFKRRVADHHVLAPDHLPHIQAVADMVRQARADGRVTALVSASDCRQVEVIAAHLVLFDLVVGTGSDEAGGAKPVGHGHG